MTRAHPIIAQLHETRTARGLSRATVARLTGYSIYTLLQWEHGRRSPRLDGLTDYAQALGYTINLTKDGDP